MNSADNILKGKQIGYREKTEKDGIVFFHSVAVQKCNEKFKVFICKIKESQLAIFEDVESDVTKIIQFDTIEAVLSYFSDVLKIDIEKLRPLKGQKIFNPKF